MPSAALLARRGALGAGFDESMQVAEDVDLVWRLVAAGWRVRYEPAAEVAHEHRCRPARGCAAGRSTAPARRCWPAARRGGRAGGHLAVVGRRLGAAAHRPPAGVLAAGGVVGTRLRPSWPAGCAAPGAGRRTGWRPALVLRGTAASGRTLARAVTRHHWPLALAAALVSRRARRLVAGVAVADAVGGWWPHRREIDLPPFAAGRRLEDLAYGAGLWCGALRARRPRACCRPRRRRSARRRGATRTGLIDRGRNVSELCGADA